MIIKTNIITLLTLISVSSFAQETGLNKTSWIQLATQTCMLQAPKNPTVQALRLNRNELNANCQCVAQDMWVTLPVKERLQLQSSMQKRESLQLVGERLMTRPDVKQAVLACRVATWWD